MQKYFFIFFVFIFQVAQSQDEEATISINKKGRTWDTLKYRKFERVLIVGLYQQHRDFNNEFTQLATRDTSGASTTNYYAESKLIGGLVLNYDKFSLSFGVRTQPQEYSAGKGYTKTFNIGFNVGDNRWVSENYYRRFTGFYDKNTEYYDTMFKQTGNYHIQPNLTSSLLMNRFSYFTNHKKFSYKSGFGCNYRQLRSAATWIVGGSFNVYTLNNDSSFFPIQTRKSFGDYANLKGFQSINLGCNLGAAGTLVILKSFFLTGYFIIGPEQQWRNYNFGGGYRNTSYVFWSGSTRIALGFNMHRFYLLFSNLTDFSLYNSKALSFTSQSITQNFTFGWRFHAKTPMFYQKIMKTKWYSYL